MTNDFSCGHTAPPPAQQPGAVSCIQTHVEIDPKKLGIEGHKLLAQIEVLERWMVMFSAFRGRSLDLAERRVLGGVVEALGEDAERLKMELTQFALRRGAATLSEPEGGA